jgi:hypothetical protein
MVTGLIRGTFNLRVDDVEYCVDGELVTGEFDYAISPESIWVLQAGWPTTRVRDVALRDRLVAEVMAWGKANDKRITFWE